MNTILVKEKKRINGISCHVLPCDYMYIANVNVLDKVQSDHSYMAVIHNT
jgi:hypothetical protein